MDQMITNKLQPIQEQKLEKSHPYFKETKVSSCAHVNIINNVAQATPFYKRPHQSYADLMQQSSEHESMSQHFHKIRPDMHLGMETKPLVSYDPNCKRNILPVEECKMPANNASKIVIGERTYFFYQSQKYDRHYVTTSQNTYGNFGKVKLGSNSGINSAATRLHHTKQGK